jgi:hypothetical protein
MYVSGASDGKYCASGVVEVGEGIALLRRHAWSSEAEGTGGLVVRLVTLGVIRVKRGFRYCVGTAMMAELRCWSLE